MHDKLTLSIYLIHNYYRKNSKPYWLKKYTYSILHAKISNKIWALQEKYLYIQKKKKAKETFLSNDWPPAQLSNSSTQSQQ